jgi:hypothetical protein
MCVRAPLAGVEKAKINGFDAPARFRYLREDGFFALVLSRLEGEITEEAQAVKTFSSAC